MSFIYNLYKRWYIYTSQSRLEMYIVVTLEDALKDGKNQEQIKVISKGLSKEFDGRVNHIILRNLAKFTEKKEIINACEDVIFESQRRIE